MQAPTATSPREYAERRERLAARLDGGALVLHGGELRTRSHDTEFRFRPDSDFHFLTGLAEPGAVLVFRPGRDPELTLFVRPKDPEAEVWSGRRVGPEGAKTHYGANEAHPIESLPKELPRLLDGMSSIHAPIGRYEALDRRLRDAVDHLWRRNRYGETPPAAFHDARHVMSEARILKDPPALRSLRRAVDITAEAHLEAMRAVRPGLHEYEIEARIEYCFRRHGSSGPGYGSIVGGGDNATILHYVENSDPLRDGDLLLVDAGCEWELFSGDITRTYPVGGTFSPAQRELYEVVLAANLAGLELAKPGGDIEAIHRRCLGVLTQGLIDLGLIEGGLEEAIDQGRYKPFYMHRTSHWLGVDVHDMSAYTLGRAPRPFVPGHVFTVEPGLYIAAHREDVPARHRGTGIRSADDVPSTDGGAARPSAAAPKDVAAIEAIVGKG